jgi:hypothetical protein
MPEGREGGFKKKVTFAFGPFEKQHISLGLPYTIPFAMFPDFPGKPEG